MDIELLLQEAEPWYAIACFEVEPLLYTIKQNLLRNTGNSHITIRDILYNAHLFTPNVEDVVKEWKNGGSPKYILA